MNKKEPSETPEEKQLTPLQKIEKYAREQMSSMSHGFDHVERVYKLSMRIGNAEKADMEILLAAALLHDIGRDLEDHIGADHAEASAMLAEEFLQTLEGFPEEKIRRVLDAIKEHRFSTVLSPQSLEAKVLSDADKLDAMGAIGIARAFTYGGRHRRDVRGTLEHFDVKLLKLKDGMFTTTARRVAEGRHIYMGEYMKRYREEMEGMK